MCMFTIRKNHETNKMGFWLCRSNNYFWEIRVVNRALMYFGFYRAKNLNAISGKILTLSNYVMQFLSKSFIISYQGYNERISG